MSGSGPVATDHANQAVAMSTGMAAAVELLRRSSFEVTPGQADDVEQLRALPRNATVAITFLPTSHPRDLVRAAALVRAAGHDPVPHLAARSLASRADLAAALKGFQDEAAVTRVLVIAGDLASPRGPFPDSVSLLETGLLAENGIRSVSFAAHPEGSPLATEEQSRRALVRKLTLCREHGLEGAITTQFCFEAGPILRFLTSLPAEAVGRPIRIGVAGPASPTTLLKFALRCGVGASMRALQKQGVGKIGRLVNEGNAEGLVMQLASALAQHPELPVEGLHFYSFGGLGMTIAWHTALLARLQGQRE